jgi:hypothetical protein
MVQSSQQDLVIYKVKGHEAVDLIKGHQHSMLADSALVQDFDKKRFHIHIHWWWRDLDEPALKPIKSGFIYHDTCSVLVLDEVAKVPEALGDVDVLYVTAGTKDHTKYLLDQLQADRVVLSVNLDWKTRNYWQQLLKERQIDYHDMRSDGAFVMSEYKG